MNFEEKQALIDNVKSKLGNHKLLYLCLYGSHLYGMNTAESDMDLRGVFLPSLESLYLNEVPKEFNYTTGGSNSKNSADDVDMKIFSIQKFIELVRKGDSNGTDLLFSTSNPDCVLYYNEEIKPIMEGYNQIMNLKQSDAYIGYAIGQAKRYGVKGSRLGVIKAIKEYLEWVDSSLYFDDLKLADIVDSILKQFGDESYCFKKDIKGVDYLVLCGSCHQMNITITEFYNRIKKTYDSYGHRAEQAQLNEGIDWKALSHAVRVLYQCEELYKTGRISFPLKDKDKLLGIKTGKFLYKDVEDTIVKLLDKVNDLKEKTVHDYKYNKDFVLSELTKLYKGKEG